MSENRHAVYKEKSQYYRNALGRFVGHEVILDCNDFELRHNENGKTLILLKAPNIVKVRGVHSKPFIVDHLWIHLPEDDSALFEARSSVARKIRVKGRIREYVYKETGLAQVGVSAANVMILKYKKDIAKKYNLDPGEQISNKQLQLITGARL